MAWYLAFGMARHGHFAVLAQLLPGNCAATLFSKFQNMFLTMTMNCMELYLACHGKAWHNRASSHPKGGTLPSGNYIDNEPPGGELHLTFLVVWFNMVLLHPCLHTYSIIERDMATPTWPGFP